MNRLKLMEKEIDLDQSEIVYQKAFTQETLSADWQPASGEWSVEDGWLTGLHRQNAGGMIYSKAGFPGDVLLEFTGRTVPPCRNDLNFVWNTQGWDAHSQDAGIGYIAGIGGWWDGKLGVEHYPTNRFRAITPLLPLEAGRAYRIQAGSIAGHCFIFVDGALALEAFDPDPIDNRQYTKIGFGTFCSHVQYRGLVVRKLAWKPVVQQYEPNF